MKNKIKTLELIGQTTSIKQFETAHEMLSNQGFTNSSINDLVNSNTPLVCSWAPDEDDDDKKITQ